MEGDTGVQDGKKETKKAGKKGTHAEGDGMKIRQSGSAGPQGDRKKGKKKSKGKKILSKLDGSSSQSEFTVMIDEGKLSDMAVRPLGVEADSTESVVSVTLEGAEEIDFDEINRIGEASAEVVDSKVKNDTDEEDRDYALRLALIYAGLYKDIGIKKDIETGVSISISNGQFHKIFIQSDC